MALREFEFYHGAVITKILRKDMPVTLTLIETDVDKSWSVYEIVDDAGDKVIYMKYCASPRETSKRIAWVFNFIPKHLEELSRYKDIDLYLALICVNKDLQFEPMEVCLLNREEISETIDIGSNTSQTITVFCETGKKLRVRGSSTNGRELKIKRGRIDDFGLVDNLVNEIR